MGTIIEFPVDAASRRPGSTMVLPPDHPATILILPAIRIERHVATRDDDSPEQGDAPRRRRRRRVRS